jgi:thiol-disulfide isomerase/thioredoxin
MNRVLLVIILVIQIISLFGIYTNYEVNKEINKGLTEIPSKIDLLVSASDKEINIDIPECPECPSCKDYTPDFDKLRKQLKSNNAPQGYYYYYGGCR